MVFPLKSKNLNLDFDQRNERRVLLEMLHMSELSSLWMLCKGCNNQTNTSRIQLTVEIRDSIFHLMF